MARRKRKFFKRFWKALWKPEMLILPGQIAFFLFLSLVPTITIIGYTCSYLNLSNDLVNTLLTNAIGAKYAGMLSPIITAGDITPRFFITLAVGFFIASNGMSSMIIASNTIYGIKDSGFFIRRFKAIIMELVIVVLFLFIVIVPLLGTSILNILHYFNFDVETTEVIVNIVKFLKGPFAWIVVFVFIKLLYTMAPDKKIPSKNVNIGTVFTTIGWIVITMVYSIYINKYANYSIFYGALANIVMLMLWVYLLSFIFVIGLALNYDEELEKTGIIDVRKIIEESANSEPVLPVEEKKNKIFKRKKKDGKDSVKESTEDYNTFKVHTK